MKYCFELYQIEKDKKNKFLGYKTVIADSTEQAYLSAKELVGENIYLSQIWIPNSD